MAGCSKGDMTSQVVARLCNKLERFWQICMLVAHPQSRSIDLPGNLESHLHVPGTHTMMTSPSSMVHGNMAGMWYNTHHTRQTASSSENTDPAYKDYEYKDHIDNACQRPGYRTAWHIYCLMPTMTAKLYRSLAAMRVSPAYVLL